MDTKELIELVERATKKDNAAMEKLYKEFYQDVLFVCKKYNLNDADAEDMAQETFIKAFKEVGSLDKAGSFKSWLLRIASNNCLNLLKHQKTLVMDTVSTDEEVLEIPDKSKNSEDVMIDEEVKQILAQMMEELPVEQRVTLFMYYYQDYSVKEIANAYGCSENTVLSRLNYARKAMRKKADAMENKGVKLRTIAVLPFLYLFFAEERKTFACEIPDCVSVISNVMGASATATSTATAGATTAATVAAKATVGISIGKIIAIAVSAIAVIGIGVGVGIGVSKNKRSNSDEPNKQSISIDEEVNASVDESNKNTDNEGEEGTTEAPTVAPREKYDVYKQKVIYYNDDDEIMNIHYFEYDSEYRNIRNYSTDPEGNVIDENTGKFNENGKLLEEVNTRNGGEHYMTKIYEYNDAGILIKHTEYYGEDYTLNEVGEYDANGNLIKLDDYYYDNYEINTYDDQNRLLTSYTYDENGKLLYENKYTYYDDENAIEMYYDDVDSRYPGVTKKYYYDDGRVKSEDSWLVDSNGEYMSHTWAEYEYNENNDLVLRRHYNGEDLYADEVYKYDENYRLIESINYYHSYVGETPKVMNRYVYKYDEAGNEIYYSWWTGDEGENLRTETVREFDEYGNHISTITTRDSLYLHVEYIHDEKNGLVKEIEYDEQGLVEGYIVYENIYVKSEE